MSSDKHHPNSTTSTDVDAKRRTNDTDSNSNDDCCVDWTRAEIEQLNDIYHRFMDLAREVLPLSKNK
jgi:hypothetical protein